ncbi:MAG: CCA tRNA nucleotidyltransferase [Clostridiales bacterium]|nr:CCA tRNA nucleotidyltransferase [Candidatus Equinaster intestinalis]
MYSLPKYVQTALTALKSKGFKAYAVGGCVRDTLLNIKPDDYDITTNALPEEIVSLFDKTVLTGIKHGTVTVIIDKKPIEITTFRSDGNYSNHRKPDSVSFLKSIEGDLSRRDFTVNAMAFDGENEIIDLFGGKEDLKNKIIRAVGDPKKRFTEDALRILRALRFAARLGFSIEENTLTAIKNTAYLLKNVSRERIFAELAKILTSPNPEILETLIICGGMEFLGIKRDCSLSGLNALKDDLPIRFYRFSVLSGVSPQKLCKELKTDSELLKYCKNLDLLFEMKICTMRIGIKKMLFYTNLVVVIDYLLLVSPASLPILTDILSSDEPYEINHLAVNGNDLLKLGISGKEVGRILKSILFQVIQEPSFNQKEKIIQSIKLYVTNLNSAP